MSNSRRNKRRRSQAFPEEDESHAAVEQDVESPVADQTEPYDEGQTDQATLDKADKERECWDAFREENYEAIEQLPLSLQRQYTLMRELDQQAHAYHSDLLPTIQRYILLRRSLAAEPKLEVKAEPSHQDADLTSVVNEPSNGMLCSNNSEVNGSTASPIRTRPSTPPPMNGVETPSALTSLVTPKRSPAKQAVASTSTPRTPTPMPIPSERLVTPQTTRAMLSHIAWLSEEHLHASEEKVNLAQAAYDSIERHIRLLDLSVKEQETSLKIGMRPGTHPAPIVLPDLVVPRYRQPRAPTGELDGMDSGGPSLGMVTTQDQEGQAINDRRKGKKGRRSHKRATESQSVEPVQRAVPRSLRLTLSAAPPAVELIDPNEPRFCYCNQVSFGEMIACDGKKCQIEWFHLGCVGLSEAPKGNTKWYCIECQAKNAAARRGRS